LIAVVADDITGAAEAAGAGLRQGLQVALDTAVEEAPVGAQLWALALNTRSMQRDEAVAEIRKTIAALLSLGVCRIFKKTDSALRGHVAAELEAQRTLQGKSAVLLCPANPAGGRTVANGVYRINNVPLHLTGFANDPEFPATTSNVRQLLQQTCASALPATLNVANAASREELHAVAASLAEDEDVVPAGSAAFFEAWLSSLNTEKNSVQPSFPPPSFASQKTLVVCGSAFSASQEWVQAAQAKGAPVFYIAPHQTNTPQLAAQLRQCAAGAIQALHTADLAVVAVAQPTIEGEEAAATLRDATAQVVEKIAGAVELQELVVEGGATAFAVIRRLGFSRFVPVEELAPGVVRMSVQGHSSIHLTIKPGSYRFPEGMLMR
jgi:uncharacterized protein YgbK (DUF1537 family)